MRRNRYMNASMYKTPCFVHAEVITLTSRAFNAAGFSTRTCLRAFAALTTYSAWRCCGRGMYTASISGSARSVSYPSYAFLMPNSDANARALPISRLATATISTPSSGSRKNARAIRAVPRIPKRIIRLNPLWFLPTETVSAVA